MHSCRAAPLAASVVPAVRTLAAIFSLLLGVHDPYRSIAHPVSRVNTDGSARQFFYPLHTPER